MGADALTNLWLGFMVVLAFGLMYGIHRLSRRHRKAVRGY